MHHRCTILRATGGGVPDAGSSSVRITFRGRHCCRVFGFSRGGARPAGSFRTERCLRGAAPDTLMLTPPAGLAVYVATRPVDFRKGAQGLALLAKETLGHDPMKGVAVVFRARRADRVNRRLGWQRPRDVLEAAREGRLQVAAHCGRRDANERGAARRASGRDGLDAHACAPNPTAESDCLSGTKSLPH